ncbi:hypothetical protein SAMN05216266_10881 [Amycolatopsis marina]|uniref:Uncharacterized protein n=1 Tax=Amycolatopsis marina TaxID=490629 RepID=A0A1I1A237_9PSEU|nr:hypothetical protein [Amycolatopsis marina]SFB31582.1 hypothetical protein SAMN05216266_10881 [Amycolatopsis marina]
MDSTENLQQLRSRLGSIGRENSERLALIEQRAAKAAKESKDTTQRLATDTDEVLARLSERAQRVKNAGGWATEGSVAKSTVEENDFGFDEDDQAREPQPDAAPATRPLPPVPPTPPVVAPPMAPARAASVRHVRRAPVEEEDYAQTDWTAD